MPTFLPVPLGLVPKGNTGGFRIIADSSFTPQSIGRVPHGERDLPRSVNDAIHKDSVTTCRYGSTLVCVLYFIVNPRIQYELLLIYFLLLDTVSAFRHVRVHYAVSPLLAAWVFHSLYVFTGMSFGAVWSPGSYSIVEELVCTTLGLFTIESIRANAAALAFSEQFRQKDPDVARDSLEKTRRIKRDAFNPGITFPESSRIFRVPSSAIFSSSPCMFAPTPST